MGLLLGREKKFRGKGRKEGDGHLIISLLPGGKGREKEQEGIRQEMNIETVA